jgi:hypothetical protein
VYLHRSEIENTGVSFVAGYALRVEASYLTHGETMAKKKPKKPARSKSPGSRPSKKATKPKQAEFKAGEAVFVRSQAGFLAATIKKKTRGKYELQLKTPLHGVDRVTGIAADDLVPAAGTVKKTTGMLGFAGGGCPPAGARVMVRIQPSGVLLPATVVSSAGGTATVRFDDPIIDKQDTFQVACSDIV